MMNMVDNQHVGAGILPIAKSTGRILLGRRSFGPQHTFPNCWGLFGGTYEDEDNQPKVTAKREFYEETKCGKPYTISDKPLYIQSTNHNTYYTFVGIFQEEFVPYVSGDDKHSQEHLDYGWFTLEEICSQPEANMIPGLKEAIVDKSIVIKRIIDYYCSNA